VDLREVVDQRLEAVAGLARGGQRGGAVAAEVAEARLVAQRGEGEAAVGQGSPWASSRARQGSRRCATRSATKCVASVRLPTPASRSAGFSADTSTATQTLKNGWLKRR
jgi:hypothetical protein